MKNCFIIIIFVFLSFSFLNAQDKKSVKQENKKNNNLTKKKVENLELKILEEKLSLARTTLDMAYYSGKILDYHEKVLKKIEAKHLERIERQIKHIKKFSKKYKKEKLLNAAKFWREFRFEQGAYEEALFDGGSMRVLARIDARTRITEERIKNFKIFKKKLAKEKITKAKISLLKKALGAHEKILKKLEDKHLKEIEEQEYEVKHWSKKYKKEKLLNARKFWRKFRKEQALYEESCFKYKSKRLLAKIRAKIRITKERIDNLKKLLTNEYYR